MRLPIALLALAVLPAALQAQSPSLEGSKWAIEQEGADSASIWWFGSQGRVRTGDVGTLLPGYKWRQSGDSVFVTVGDTVRYAGQLLTNRFVGIRTGPRRQEGWWSGSRADGPTAVAAAPSEPAPVNPTVAPAAATTAATDAPKPNPSTESMSRPVEPSTPASTGSAPRTLRRIERTDGSGSSSASMPSSTSQSGGQEIRRIQRTLPATTPVPRSALVGRWVQADEGGVIIAIDFKDDGSVAVELNSGSKGEGTWSNESEGTRAVIGGARREAVIRVWQEGSELRLVVETASGAPVTRRFRRAG